MLYAQNKMQQTTVQKTIQLYFAIYSLSLSRNRLYLNQYVT